MRLYSGFQHSEDFWFFREFFVDIVGNGNGRRSLKLDQDCESGIDGHYAPV